MPIQPSMHQHGKDLVIGNILGGKFLRVVIWVDIRRGLRRILLGRLVCSLGRCPRRRIALRLGRCLRFRALPIPQRRAALGAECRLVI